MPNYGKSNRYENADKSPGSNKDFAAAKAVLRSCFEVMKTQQNEIAEFAYQFFTNTYNSPKEALKQGSDALATALAPELCTKMSRACNKKQKRRTPSFLTVMFSFQPKFTSNLKFPISIDFNVEIKKCLLNRI